METYQALNLKSAKWFLVKPHHWRRLSLNSVRTWNAVILWRLQPTPPRFSGQLHKYFLLVWYLTSSFVILKVFLMPLHLKQFNAVFIWSLSWSSGWLLVMYHTQWFLWCDLLTTERWMKITVTSSWGLWSDLNHFPWVVWLFINQCPHF